MYIRAEEYCERVFDGTHDSPKPKDEGRLLITSKNILNQELNFKDAYLISPEEFDKVNRRSQIHQWDILFSMIGTVGSIYLERNSEINYCIKNMGVFSCGDKDKAEWLYYYLQSDEVKKRINAFMSGAVQKFVPLQFLRNLPVPEYDESKRNVAIVLSSIDKRIENLRAQNRVLEQTAKTIYDYTFLQCAGHQTTYNKTLNRNIPTNWEVSTIGCYIKESKGGDWGKENPEKNYNLQVSCIRGADIEKMTDLPIRYILAKNSSKLLQEFDLVVEISGGSPTQSTGRSRLMTKELLEMFDNKLICSNFCQAVTMKNPQYAYYISFMWKMFYDNGIFFNFEGKTSGIKNFQLDQFVDTMWFFPDLKTVEKFNAQVAPLIKKQLFNAKQIEALTTQRNTLLPLLMTGQIEV